MATFAERHGFKRPMPPRILVEQDSEDLRATLWQVLTREGSQSINAYRTLCDFLNRLPDQNIWSDNFAEGPARAMLEDLHWTEVYDLFESEYEHSQDFAENGARSYVETAVNKSLERSGIAYEMRDGKFELIDPEAVSLKIRHSEHETLDVLTDEFAAVRIQYQKALSKLHAIPADYEGALSDALNSLEAVTKIITGDLKKTLSDIAPKLFPNGEAYHSTLKVAIEKLYIYASNVPGSRHGRYADPQIAYQETVMVVRIVGAMMAFLIADYRADTPVSDGAKAVW